MVVQTIPMTCENGRRVWVAVGGDPYQQDPENCPYCGSPLS